MQILPILNTSILKWNLKWNQAVFIKRLWILYQTWLKLCSVQSNAETLGKIIK